MNEPERVPEMRISDDERHAVAEALREAAGAGRLDLEELDERLEATYAARTYADLVPITADLPAVGSAATIPVRPAGATPATTSGSPQRHLAIMSGFERKGVWTVPSALGVTCVMGGAELDMRQARFETHEVAVTVSAVMGGVRIVVPHDVDVIMEGVGVMGGFSGPGGDADLPADARTLRVKGYAFWSGVQVERRDE